MKYNFQTISFSKITVIGQELEQRTIVCQNGEILDKLILFFFSFSFSSDNLHIFEDELQQGATSIAVVNESGKVPSKNWYFVASNWLF